MAKMTKSEAGMMGKKAQAENYKIMLLRKLSKLPNVSEANMREYRTYEDTALLKAILVYKRKNEKSK